MCSPATLRAPDFFGLKEGQVFEGLATGQASIFIKRHEVHLLSSDVVFD
jgi:hypothetical protein